MVEVTTPLVASGDEPGTMKAQELAHSSVWKVGVLVKRDLANAPPDVSRHTSLVHSGLRDAVGWLIAHKVDICV